MVFIECLQAFSVQELEILALIPLRTIPRYPASCFQLSNQFADMAMARLSEKELLVTMAMVLSVPAEVELPIVRITRLNVF